MARDRSSTALVILRLALGVFFVAAGLGKLGWYRNSGLLLGTLTEWLKAAPPWSRWYLEHVALPGVWVFARVVPAAELGGGLALLSGIGFRPVAFLLLLMVLNFHVASGAIFRTQFLSNGYGLPVLGSLAAIALGRESGWIILPGRRKRRGT